MRGLQLAAVAVWSLAVGYGVVALSAVPNGSFAATWQPAADPAEQYEFRWRHFAAADWLSLPTVAGAAGSMRVTFAPLPNTPTTDRWMCLDARSRVGDRVSPWLSEMSGGATCSTIEAAIIAVPTPPAPTPIPPPVVEPPPLPQPDIFTGITQTDGRLTLDYQVGSCPRGVQQITSAPKNGSRTITLICRR